jgi:hypothetical protein
MSSKCFGFAAASRRQQNYPAGRPVNSQAGRLRYVAFGSALLFIFYHSRR